MMRILKQSLFDYNNIIPLKSEVQNKKGFFSKELYLEFRTSKKPHDFAVFYFAIDNRMCATL